MTKMSFFPEISNRMDGTSFEVCIQEIGVSIPDLARRLDVDRRTIMRWISGEVPIPGAVALLIGVAMDALRFTHHWKGHGISADDMPSRLASVRTK